MAENRRRSGLFLQFRGAFSSLVAKCTTGGRPAHSGTHVPFSIALAALALLITLCALPAPSFAQTDLVIYDDGLENGCEDWSWATTDPSYTGLVHSGTVALRVTARPYDALALHCTPFDTYTYGNLSFWIHGGATAGQVLQLRATRSQTPQAATVQVGPLAPNTWQHVSIPLATLGVSRVTDMDGFQLQDRTGSATIPPFVVDDVTITAIPPPDVVNVTVDASQIVNAKVDPRMFGLNTAAWDTLLNSDSTTGVLQTLDTKILRFPGGSLSDEYHWLTNTSRSNTTPWGSNFDDFAKAALSVKAQAIITTNYGSGTPEEAADWVRYSNVTKGYGFQYWEIGNESYGSWEYDTRPVPHDPYSYANAAADYIAAMKAADPTIKVGVNVLYGEEEYANVTNHPAYNARTGQTHNGWTPVLFATLKQRNVKPDFVSFHRYVQPPGTESDAGVLQSSSTWGMMIGSIRQMLTDYMGPSSSAVEILVTENNSVTTKPGKQTTSLVNALYMADSLGRILQTEARALLWWCLRGTKETAYNNSAALYGWRNYGDYGIVNQQTIGYPTFYADKLLRTFARGGERIVSAATDFNLLAAYAARRPNGDLTLLVINKSPTSTIRANVTLGGFEPLSTGSITSYGIPQDEAARTGSGSPDIVRKVFGGAGKAFTYNFAPYSLTVFVLPQSTGSTTGTGTGAEPTPTTRHMPPPLPARTPPPTPIGTRPRTPPPLPTPTPAFSQGYGFDGGSTQGWTAGGGPVTGVWTAQSPVYQGTRSLAINVTATGATGKAFVSRPNVPAGATVTFHVWVPFNAGIIALQFYAQQDATANWAWTGKWVSTAYMQPGFWNSYTLTIPANAKIPLNELGIQFFTSSGPWSGTVYVDSITW